jgi:hypothetical protein
VKPGRLQLVVKTTGREPMILEQPVFVTVKDPNEAPEEAPKETTLQASTAAPNATK